MGDDGTPEIRPNEPESACSESGFPARLRLLCIGALEPSCVNLSFQLEALGCAGLALRWVPTAAEALTLLRESNFDCMIVQETPLAPGGVCGAESLALLQAIRASGCDDPVVIVTAAISDEMWDAACADNAEILVTPYELESRALVPMIRRAMERVDMVRENRRLDLADRRRLNRERDEAERLLNQQRQIILDFELLSQPEEEPAEDEVTVSIPLARAGTPAVPNATRPTLPAEINEYYQELLRIYVIMGSGNLGGEIAKLAELLTSAGLSPRQTLEVHLERVEVLVRGLGNRSARHVLARADLLALELMIHLAECHQRRAAAPSVESPLSNGASGTERGAAA